MINQLIALFYKNFKLQLRTPFATLFQILLPICCVLIAYSLQSFAHSKAGESSKPIPSSPLTYTVPLNFPESEQPFKSFFKPQSCLKINRFAFGKDVEDSEKEFVKKKLTFDNSWGFRKENCTYKQNDTKKWLISPYFNETQVSDPDEMNKWVSDNELKLFNNGSFNIKERQTYTYPLDGFTLFKKATKSKVAMTIMSNNLNNQYLHRGNYQTQMNADGAIIPLQTEGFMNLIDYVSNGILFSEARENKAEVTQIVALSGAFLSGGWLESFFLKIFQLLGLCFYPMAIGFGFPVVLSNLGLEKEDKIADLMRINGMSQVVFVLANFIYYLIFFGISASVFFIVGHFMLEEGIFHMFYLELSLFVLLWNCLQITFSLFLMRFINNASAGNAVGYTFSIIMSIFSSSVCTVVYPSPGFIPIFYKFIPQVLLVRLFQFFILRGSDSLLPEDIQEYKLNMLMLLLTSIVYLILSILLNSKGFFSSKPEKLKVNLDADKHESVTKEEQIVKAAFAEHDSKYAILVHGVSKTYKSSGRSVAALKRVSMSIEENTIFGLLGVNGAGKTTLISIITQFLKADKGDVMINGETKSNGLTGQKVSFCPQQDLLWTTLTIREHLYIFGMLRGVFGSKLERSIDPLLTALDLKVHQDKIVGELSGGTKRRLSLAICLIGDISVVLMDEPTTGLDPKLRRQFWNIIKELQVGKTFLISTHLMEEAEALCSKVGVLKGGKLMAIGTSSYLRKQFCDYKILDLVLADEKETITEELIEEFGCQESERFKELVRMKIPEGFKMTRKLLEKVGGAVPQRLSSWSLRSASLEEVFHVIGN